jgi:hypothetical protein
MKHKEAKRGLRHYVEHLTDITVLRGNRLQLDRAAAGGAVRHEPERVECRLRVLLLRSLRRPAPILAARRDRDAPASRSHSALQPPPTRNRAKCNAAAAASSGRCGNRGEGEQGSGGGLGRAGAEQGMVAAGESLRCVGGARVGWIDPQWPRRRVAAKKPDMVGATASSHADCRLVWGLIACTELRGYGTVFKQNG